jgi:hypothetical protein
MCLVFWTDHKFIGGNLVKKTFIHTLALLMSISIIFGCQEQEQKTTAQAPQETQTPQAPQSSESQPVTAGYSGTVIETMNSGGYTYVNVDTGKETLWAAANQFEVKAGDKVMVPQGMPMKNYHSKTLDRTFELVYFVSNISVAGSEQPAGQIPQGPAGMTQNLAPPTPAAPVQIDLSGIEKPEGGKTVAEIFSKKADLAGQRVVVRGKVVKFNPGIMGRNWIHLQDGTGEEGTNDLTITTNAMAKVGDTVTASGEIELDKDFGAGYVYNVLIENAEIIVE